MHQIVINAFSGIGNNTEKCIGVRVEVAMVLRVVREGLSIKRQKQRYGKGRRRESFSSLGYKPFKGG